ncbi:MAG TPA: endonuclease/exonuclease/phosphatase family protein [Phycisphaerales bacterium]|nr:endonuclease/exonuclease/phosphatase family protein [Phycisphaerales bacterium]
MSALLWLGVVVVAVCAISAWTAVAMTERASRGEIGPWFWWVDLPATLPAQAVMVSLLLACVSVAMRRTCSSVAFGVVVAALLAAMVSAPRLGRSASDDVVRVLIYNANTASGRIDDKDAMLIESDADVLVVLETPTALVDRFEAGHGARELYPYGWLPGYSWSGYPVILSRLPTEPRKLEGMDDLRRIRDRLWAHHYRLEVVHSPGGSFVLVQLHARSPRRPARWRAGLAQLLEAADLVREAGERTGLPVVVAGDFNSPPTGVRSRAFARRSGLVRAKPVFRLGGSYPSGLPAEFGVAIDGVFASPGVGVRSWRVLGSAGSDHRAVVVGLDMSGYSP